MEEPAVESESNEEITPELCRLCDETGEKMYGIFDDNEDGYQIIGLIKENLPIVIYKSDPLSKQICEKCVLNLQIISGLKKRSRKTQEQYVQELRTKGDTTDKNVLLYLGCTGIKLVDNEEEEEEEDELKDKCTSTDDLTILCSNCKQSILDASTVNGEIELCTDLHHAIAESLKKNKVLSADSESEKVLRKRKIQPLYHELDDSLCSSLTELTRNTEGDDASQYGFDLPSELESEESNEEERPAKRRKIVEPAGTPKPPTVVNGDTPKFHEAILENGAETTEDPVVKETINYEEFFKDEPEFTYEPLSLLQLSLNVINIQNVPDYTPITFIKKDSRCACSYCAKPFENLKLLALHEPEHMEVDVEEKIDNPKPWPESHPFAIVRNKWLTYFDENGYGEEDIVVDEAEDADVDVVTTKEEASLLVEKSDQTMDMSKKDQVVLVEMKPMVNGVFLGDYTKEERKAFYQCMRIGGQTKRFCTLCRYCFKDNWAIESHYFSLACHYTCRYCGMRFNKQRHRFDEHTKEHLEKKDPISEKIYTASKVNNVLPKVIQPDKIRKIVPVDPEKPREIRLEDYNQPMIRGTDNRNRYIQPSVQTQFDLSKVKEEPKDFVASQSKTGNQAYFCRKCYKVFFKLDEFNTHSKNCDYNQYPPTFRAMQLNMNPQNSPSPTSKPQNFNSNSKPAGPNSIERRNGDISSAGRPIRNCVKDIGTYKDEVYIPKQYLNETIPGPPQSFVCHICGTPFPTIYSRNSHMRIHKGETAASSAGQQQQQAMMQQRLQNQIQQQRAVMQQKQQQQYQKQLQRNQQNHYPQFEEVKIKQEPVDTFEPMVEIHEGEQPSAQNYPAHSRELGGGAVSITPIAKNPSQKPAFSPNIMKLVQNNPNISISKRASEKSSSSSSSSTQSSHNSMGKSGGGTYLGVNSSVYSPNLSHNSPNSYGSVSNSNLALISPDADKSYKCSSCWEAFSNKSHLYFHKKNQCEGSRFPCPFCKKRFGTEAAYSSHIFYSHPE